MLKLLEAHDIPFELLFVEQSSDGLFNRAALLNAGYTLLDQTRLESSIPLENQRVCFHDIDYVPRNAMAFAPYVQSATYQLASRSTCKPEPAAWVASRVICMQRPVVDRVNGWATDYWGWGFEDADFDLRLLRVFGSQPTAWQTVLTTTERNMAANLTRDASAPWYADDHWWKIPARGTRFQDKIEPSGLPPQSTSFGVSFGDFNNDTLPDIFMGFHYTGLRHEHQVFEKPAVYVNMGGGQPTFRKLSLTDMPGVATKVEHDCNSTCYVLHRSGDLHGATWHDFDGDGDQDIFINTGGQGGMGSSPCLFLVNEGGAFTDKAFQFNLSLNELRGRVSLFFDWNGDGLSDLLVTAQPGGRGVAGRSVVYQQQREAYRVDVARLPLHRAAHPLERPAELRARAADGEGECLDPLAVAK
ncbi:hypothetical protein AB1Y20_022626 [Prymnesium parvum]|uniref:Galactosyltransferase C-terminal domain-containing protein n=1 Tax=Prymnesium parvum TaxID=97485 RepID=A0AB34JK25_PRYPA